MNISCYIAYLESVGGDLTTLPISVPQKTTISSLLEIIGASSALPYHPRHKAIISQDPLHEFVEHCAYYFVSSPNKEKIQIYLAQSTFKT